MARDIARCHHEKFDGSGYPAGLAGEDIPLCARIVALADVYDALTTKRVYKPAFSHAEAVALIREGRGRHFDPAIVRRIRRLRRAVRGGCRATCPARRARGPGRSPNGRPSWFL